MLSVTHIDTFYNGLTLRHHDTINAAAGGTFMKRRPEECYDLIENMTAHHNDYDTSAQRSESSSSITSSSDMEITALKAKMTKINKNLMRVLQNVYAAGAYQGGNSYQPQGNHNLLSYHSDDYLGPPGAIHGQNPPPDYQAPAYQAPGYQAPVHQPQIPQPQVLTTNEFTNFIKANDAILKNIQTNMTSLTNSNLELKNMFGQFMKMNTASSSGSRTLPGPTIPATSSSVPKVVERETDTTKDTVHPTNNENTKDVQPLVVQTKILILNSEPVVAPIIEPVVALVSALKPNQKPSIPYISRLHDQKLRDKANDQKEKFFQIFKDLDFNISFTNALILMPKFGATVKTLLTNKDKLSELARTTLNEHCSAVLLKKLLEKLGDPGKFLIPCDFSRMAECLALADLGASINIMPLSMWNKLSLLKLSPTCMTLELDDRLISHPVGVAEDVFVKVGTFHFPADFVVVDFDADSRVPLILGRCFLKTRRALIDVFEGELTFRVGKESITFNLDQTLRYSVNYNDMMANRIDVIDMACEEYSQEVLGFSDVIVSGNPTSYYDPIVSTTSPTLTPFGDSDFLHEEVDAFLALEDDSTSLEVDHSYVDIKGDILLLFVNDDPSLPPPNQRNYLPQVRKELEAKSDKSSIDEPLEGGFTVVENEENELILTRLVTGWRVCIDYRKLNEATHKDHFHLPFMDQMLERLARNKYYCSLDGFSGAVLGQRQEKHFRPIHYASKTMTEAESNYTTMEKEMLAVVYAFEKFRSYLIMNKSIVYTDHFARKYLFAKKDSMERFLCWVLLLQEFTFKVIGTKEAENLAVDHLS
nr:reverse transcriptase domain-containing protein [Tanacetum cinerariifolium]